jgi:hypothetical protein
MNTSCTAATPTARTTSVARSTGRDRPADGNHVDEFATHDPQADRMRLREQLGTPAVNPRYGRDTLPG